MSSTLSAIPVEKRRRLAGTLGLFAVLLIAVGAVAATGATSALIQAFVVISFIVALLLAAMAWGVASSVKGDLEGRRHEAAVDEAVATALAQAMADDSPAVREFASNACGSGCGHEHDPDEMHVVRCEHDGDGVGCSHSCDTCVLAQQRRPRPGATTGSPTRPTPSGRH